MNDKQDAAEHSGSTDCSSVYYSQRNREFDDIQSKNQGKHCQMCVKWFLGCLNGRQKWKDKAIQPNIRFEGADGQSYPRFGVDPPEDAFPLRMICDAFEQDPDPQRMGRVVY